MVEIYLPERFSLPKKEIKFILHKMKAAPMPRHRETSISKGLSYLLRHDKSMQMDAQGWALVEDVLKKRSMTKLHVTKQDLDFVVQNNDKQRYALKEEDGVLVQTRTDVRHMEGEGQPRSHVASRGS
jgi:RNA:NAD 2'-phosphotransferase (TPT1/KptA family)